MGTQRERMEDLIGLSCTIDHMPNPSYLRSFDSDCPLVRHNVIPEVRGEQRGNPRWQLGRIVVDLPMHLGS